ncbi:MAG: endopeptidase La [Acidobacteriota bacterium]|nr:endopeptidase La [Acidobacteriota bacterium]
MTKKSVNYIDTKRITLPVVPLRDMVVFPHMMAPFIVGREASVRALERSLLSDDRRIFLVAQHDPKIDDPQRQDMFDVGVIAKVVQNLRLPNGNVKVMVEGVQRAKMIELREEEGSLVGELETYTIDLEADETLTKYITKVFSVFEQYAKLSHHLAFEGLVSTIKTDDPDRFCDQLAAHLMVSTSDKQDLLELLNPYERIQRLHDLLEVEVEKVNIDKRINVKVKKQMEKAQKEYYLNEKIKAIHQELGRSDDKSDELAELKTKIEKAGLSKTVKEKAEQELKRLEAMPPVSAEATVSRNYIDWLVSVPWKKKSKEIQNLDRAEKILDEDHHGLEEPKERILEFLAVRKLAPQKQSSIICFVGPPGVGKSSLAKSIARATGRKFVRLSLGGLRDEAEIRGHRRTYIGAFPGQIVQMMKKAGTVNPVFLLDELDKMSMDFRGDPSAALLEVLDPEQNDAFKDHYLDVDYNLSRVMFIATANVSHTIPPALQDRMEMIQLPGYTMGEKLEIAKGFLVRKQEEAHGLTEKTIEFKEDGLRALIEGYTREAGVRNLERVIAKICRKVARKVVQEKGSDKVVVEPEKVTELLGKVQFRSRKKRDESEVGVATGLAWTEAGGEILEAEVGLMPGKGKLTLTGKLGDVMKESARAALSYLRSRADMFGLDADFAEDQDLHIHVPEGAIPKDGPSAGITMAVALISAVTGVPVRKEIAMTGEITLRGKVLPVGGIKHKLLAAYRADIVEILLPKHNEKDLEDLPEEVREVLEVHLVETMDEVLELALDREVESLPQGDSAFDKPAPDPSTESGSVAH